MRVLNTKRHAAGTRTVLLRKECCRAARFFVQNEIDAGRLTPELARLAPHKNILTQSVGYHGTVDPVTSTRPVGKGDMLMLCSDGLTDPIDDSTLEELIATIPFEDLAFQLVEKALDDGGEDNITVVVVKILED